MTLTALENILKKKKRAAKGKEKEKELAAVVTATSSKSGKNYELKNSNKIFNKN